MALSYLAEQGGAVLSYIYLAYLKYITQWLNVGGAAGLIVNFSYS